MTGIDQGAGLFKDLIMRDGGEIGSEMGDDTVGASGVASVLDF